MVASDVVNNNPPWPTTMPAVQSEGDTTKPGLWTMDWTVDWTMNWAFLIEMSSLAINWFAAWPIFKLGGPMHLQLTTREENLRNEREPAVYNL